MSKGKITVVSYENDFSDVFTVLLETDDVSSVLNVDGALLPYLVGEFGEPEEFIGRTFDLPKIK